MQQWRCVEVKVDKPKVTIAVVPRERFSVSLPSLASIYTETDTNFELLYIDGNSPAHVAEQLQKQSLAKGFRLLRYNRYLCPNEARNIAIKQCDTDYIVFVDNDTFFQREWLNALIECADSTDCAVVAPLYLEGPLAAGTVHFAGGEGHIDCRPGGNYYVQDHFFERHKLSEVRSQIKRMPVNLVEFHVLLVRRNLFDETGLLDEEFINIAAENDFSLTVIKAGKVMYFEPESVITYDYKFPFEWSDMPFFTLRWSAMWTEASVKRMCQKWNLAKNDPFIGHASDFRYRQRRIALLPATALTTLFGSRCAKFVERVFVKLIGESTQFAHRFQTAVMVKDS